MAGAVAGGTAGFTLRYQHFSHHCFDFAMLNVGTVKKENNIFIFLSEVVLTFGAP